MLSIMADIRGHGRVHVVWIKFGKTMELGCSLYMDKEGGFTTLTVLRYFFSVLQILMFLRSIV